MFAKSFTFATFGASLLAVSSAAPTVKQLSPRQESTSALTVNAWWGQTPNSKPLSEICANPGVDIVFLSFLNEFWAKGSGSTRSLWPSLNIGAHTMFPSEAQSAAGALGLFDGSAVAPDIQACQAAGKKVFISIGGDVRNAKSTFNNDDEATAFAHNLWNLFLGGTNNATTSPIRPFGDVVLDGLDVDHEKPNPTGYLAFLTTLRQLFSEDTTREYKINGSPQCQGHSKNRKNGDNAIPDNLIPLFDDVTVQAYNNPDCMWQNEQSADFATSMSAWSEVVTKLNPNARLFVGAGVNDGVTPKGALHIDEIANAVSVMKGLNLPNFGGFTLWDASVALDEVLGGMTYSEVMKTELSGTSTAGTRTEEVVGQPGNNDPTTTTTLAGTQPTETLQGEGQSWMPVERK